MMSHDRPGSERNALPRSCGEPSETTSMLASLPEASSRSQSEGRYRHRVSNDVPTRTRTSPLAINRARSTAKSACLMISTASW